MKQLSNLNILFTLTTENHSLQKISHNTASGVWINKGGVMHLNTNIQYTQTDQHITTKLITTPKAS